MGVLAVAELIVLSVDAPQLFRELTTGKALPFAIASAAAGVISLVLMWRRQFLAVRLSAALAVTALLWGWGVGQYPEILPGATVDQVAATQSVLTANLIAIIVAGLLVIPSLWWLYALFQRDQRDAAAASHK
jgi:cytochrome d ubiquinol oxidase subunit II